MTMIEPPSLEPVEATERRPMTEARRARIFLAHKGKCADCGVKITRGRDAYQIDHPVQLWMGGPDEDAVCRLLCMDCVTPKNAKDATERAKVKRLIENEDPEQRKSKRPMKSRGFDKTKSKRMDGAVIPRCQRPKATEPAWDNSGF